MWEEGEDYVAAAQVLNIDSDNVDSSIFRC